MFVWFVVVVRGGFIIDVIIFFKILVLVCIWDW